MAGKASEGVRILAQSVPSEDEHELRAAGVGWAAFFYLPKIIQFAFWQYKTSVA